jgi:hypothetical protein
MIDCKFLYQCITCENISMSYWVMWPYHLIVLCEISVENVFYFYNILLCYLEYPWKTHNGPLTIKPHSVAPFDHNQWHKSLLPVTSIHILTSYQWHTSDRLTGKVSVTTNLIPVTSPQWLLCLSLMGLLSLSLISYSVVVWFQTRWLSYGNKLGYRHKRIIWRRRFIPIFNNTM